MTMVAARSRRQDPMVMSESATGVASDVMSKARSQSRSSGMEEFVVRVAVQIRVWK